MTNFKEAQEQIERARRLHQQSRQSWLTVSEKLQKTERRIASLRRRSDDEARQQLQTLLREQEALRADTAKQQAEFQQNRQILIDQELLFEVFSDPTRNISQLNDNHPILLFPMRIETRFKAVAGDGDNGDRNQYGYASTRTISTSTLLKRCRRKQKRVMPGFTGPTSGKPAALTLKNARHGNRWLKATARDGRIGSVNCSNR
jgi:hypothetical protein